MSSDDSGTTPPAVAALLDRGVARLHELQAMDRLFERDTTLWTADPDEQAVCADRLGWLDAPEVFRLHVDRLTDFAAACRADGLDRVLVCGMGGSSLAAEVIAAVMPRGADGAEVRVLDSTHPAAVTSATAWADPRRTLYVIGSKSGGTLETDCLRRHFHALAIDVLGEEVAASRMVAITDAETALHQRAEEEGWRDVFLNPTDVGGRFAALTFFGLVPAVLHGVDLDAFLARAVAERDACRENAAHGAVHLAAAIGAAAAGRDRLQLRFSNTWAPLAVWVEQLIAESTGKAGRGCLPIAGDPRVGLSSRDVVLDLRLPDEPVDARQADLDWAVDDPVALAGLFYRFEVATALGSALIGVEPFDQPNVTEAKAATTSVLGGELPTSGRRVAEDERLVVEIPPGSSAQVAGDTPEAVLDSFLAGGSPGDYVALLAYLPVSDETEERLDELRRRVPEDRSTTAGYGPRYLHSTGQYHKGGPAVGRFLFLDELPPEGTDGPGPELPIPGTDWTFGRVVAAQCEGDVRALADRGLPVLRVRRRV